MPCKQISAKLRSALESYVDAAGNNLLWFATPSACGRCRRLFSPAQCRAQVLAQAPVTIAKNESILPLLKLLIGELDISPFQRNKQGFSFADYDLIARASGYRPELVGIDNKQPDFLNRKFWGLDRPEVNNANQS